MDGQVSALEDLGISLYSGIDDNALISPALSLVLVFHKADRERCICWAFPIATTIIGLNTLATMIYMR